MKHIFSEPTAYGMPIFLNTTNKKTKHTLHPVLQPATPNTQTQRLLDASHDITITITITFSSWNDMHPDRPTQPSPNNASLKFLFPVFQSLFYPICIHDPVENKAYNHILELPFPTLTGRGASSESDKV